MDKKYREVLLNDPCVYCGAKSEGLDHIEPASKGGRDGWVNRAPACKFCDCAKGNVSVLLFLLLHRQAVTLATHKIAKRNYKHERDKKQAIGMLLHRTFHSLVREAQT